MVFRPLIRIVSIAGTILESLQLCSIIFKPSIPWSASEFPVTLPKIMKFFVLQLGPHSYKCIDCSYINSFRVVFWLVVLFVIMGYFVVDLAMKLPESIATLDKSAKDVFYSVWYDNVKLIS